MTGYSRWQDLRAAYVARLGGEDAVAAGKPKLLAELAERRTVESRGPGAQASAGVPGSRPTPGARP